MEVRKIIPFPVLKINFELLGENEKNFVLNLFLITGLGAGDIILLPEN